MERRGGGRNGKEGGTVRATGPRMPFTNKLLARASEGERLSHAIHKQTVRATDLACRITFKLNETALFLQATDVCVVSAASATAANTAATVLAATTVPADTASSASKPD